MIIESNPWSLRPSSLAFDICSRTASHLVNANSGLISESVLEQLPSAIALRTYSSSEPFAWDSLVGYQQCTRPHHAHGPDIQSEGRLQPQIPHNNPPLPSISTSRHIISRPKHHALLYTIPSPIPTASSSMTPTTNNEHTSRPIVSTLYCIVRI